MHFDGVSDVYRLSPMQEGMLFHSLHTPDAGLYIEQLACTLDNCDPAAFRCAWRSVVERHDILRAAVLWEGLDEPVQLIQDAVDLPWLDEDWRDLSADDQARRFDEHIRRDRTAAFDLTRAPLMRFALIRTGEARYRFLWSQHHILLDGWSQPLVLQEVLSFYEAYRQDQDPRPPRPKRYREFIDWLGRQDPAKADDYWRGRLSDLEEPTRLATQPAATSDVRRSHASLDTEATAALEQFARQSRVTLNTLVQAAWSLWLARRTDRRSVVYGSTVACRPAEIEDVERMVGLFINTIPVRVDVDAARPLADWLQSLHAEQSRAADFSWTPLPVAQAAGPGGALFDSLLVFENYPRAQDTAAVSDLQVADAESSYRTNFPVNVIVGVHGGRLSVSMSYDAAAFDDPGPIARVPDQLVRILKAMAGAPAARIGDLAVLKTDAQVWNQTARPYERTSLAELFHAAVREHADREAAEFGDLRLTYAELNRRANRLAHQLRSHGVGPESRVGISVEPGFAACLSMLAVVKAGGAYVPLLPNEPTARREQMALESGVSLILCEEQIETPPGIERLLVSADPDTSWSTDDPPPATVSESLAYIIHTSGSTGRPKGVGVPHGAVARLVRNSDYVQFGPHTRMAQVSSYGFDAMTFEVWGAWLNGGCLVGVPRESVLEPHLLAERFHRDRLNTSFLTAALFHQAVSQDPAAFADVENLLVGGEALNPARMGEAFAAGAPTRLLNGYGPTETTTFAVWHQLAPDDAKRPRIPIGKPLANSAAYVLSRNLDELQPGFDGELYLGGDGLARGYLNDARLTAERFVPDPFSATPGARMYRTGDRARRFDSGLIDCLGRADDQIKLRGFRIELGEIETALRAHESVAEAIVLLDDALDAKRLIAFVTPQPGATLETSALRDFLRSRVPEFMLPATITALNRLPLNRNGKADRKRLVEMEQTPAVEPETKRSADAVETILAGLFAEILGVDAVDHHADFFDLGGHSLLATQLIARVRDAFQADTPLRALFESPTVSTLAQSIRAARGNLAAQSAPIEPTTGPEAPLSFAQERLWFLNRLEPESPFYNTSGALRIKGPLNADALEQALQGVVERHAVLRTRYQPRDGRATQEIVPGAVPALERVDLTALSPQAREQEMRRRAAEAAQRPFDLADGPVIRYLLLELAEQEHVLLLTMHHIVSDGWSLGVFIKETTALYRAAVRGEQPSLEPLVVQYADFARWQREQLEGPTLDRQLDYWKTQLAGAPPMLTLPTDRPRPPVQSFRGRTARFTVSAETAAGLRALSRREGATLFMTTLAAFAALLRRHSDQEDVVIGTPIANRTRPEIEPLIGFFVNTLALRVDLSGDPDFDELVGRLRTVALEAYDHQDLPFERLVEEVQPERDLSRNPLFQVMFALQNAPLPEELLEGLTLESIPPEQPSALFDLTLDIWETGDTLTGVLEYATDLFDATTIERLIDGYVRLLDSVARDSAQLVSEIPIVGPAERDRILAIGDGGALDYPHRSLGELIEIQAAATPDRIAVSHNGRRLTYEQLNARANRIARLMRDWGAGPNQFVGILEERGLDYAVALVGVAKSGAAFLPIDPQYPAERVRHMVADSGVATLITRTAHFERFALDDIATLQRALRLDSPADEALLAEKAENDPQILNQPTDTAYILYTSGSTGLPKGAMVRHDGAVSHIYAEFQELGFHPDTAFLQSAPTSSDISVWQYWGPWLIGGRTVIVDTDVVCDPKRLFAALRDERVTLIELVPVVLHELIHHTAEAGESLPALECAMVTGEAASVPLVNQWFAVFPNVPLVNCYGPTEAADDICQAKYNAPLPPALPRPPIGKPLANLTLYVLDRKLQLAPLGAPGEICVAGVGVGKGYWNRDELTADVFVRNPHPGAGSVIYRTGDLGRWLPDGSLDFLGRLDHQVKVRGFRIELGEIESALGAHAGVRDAVVLDDGEGEDRRLIAYVTPNLDADGALPVDRFEGEQVALWESLHQESYVETAGDDPTFNTIGWDSNYTGEPLPQAEMLEYVDHSVARILAGAPQRILEIGCGTGLLAYRLAAACEDYWGIDASAVAMDRLAADAARLGYRNAQFRTALAHRLETVPGRFDVIALPSVIQYFPSADYLLQVIRAAVDKLNPGGRIVLSDVRSLPLLRRFHESVERFKAVPGTSDEDIAARVDERLRREQELAVDPAFFRTLPTRISAIQHVEIAPKRGTLDNEMTRFRLDVTLRLAAPLTADVDWTPTTLSAIEDRLDQGAAAAGFRAVRNARVIDQPGALHPETLEEWAAAHGLQAHFSQWESRDDGRFDVAFTPQSADAVPSFFSAPVTLEPPRLYANNPLQEKLQNALSPMLREFLKERVPDYMVPAQFVVVDALPLLPNGKVDRRSLPRPAAPAAQADYLAPRNDAESKLVAVWADVLSLDPDRIGVRDNFFELGGHSLKATQVISRIERDLGVELPLRALFTHSTVEELARELTLAGRQGRKPIPRTPEASHHPLSHAQRRLWVLSQIDGASVSYNLPSAKWIEGPLNPEALELALSDVVALHESLRTAIIEIDGKPRQRILPPAPVAVDMIDAESDEAARRLVEQAVLVDIDLREGRPLRATLIRRDPRRWVFVLNVHHIAFDAWSERVFFRDLVARYQDRLATDVAHPSPASVQYKDYVRWQDELLSGPDGEAQRDYWLDRLTPLPAPLELPLDKPRPAVKGFAGGSVSIDLGRTVAKGLELRLRDADATLYAALVTAVAALLGRYSGQTDLIVGCPVAGRSHPDLEDQIGFFVNTLPLRCCIDPEESFSQALHRTSRSVQEALDRQDYPLDRLIGDLDLPRDPSRLPLVEAIVNLQIADAADRNTTELAIAAFEYELPTSQFDLGFYFTQSDEGLTLELRYAADLFHHETIERMARRLGSLIEAAATQPRTPLEDISLDDGDAAFYWSARLRSAIPTALPPDALIGEALSNDARLERLPFPTAGSRPEVIAAIAATLHAHTREPRVTFAVDSAPLTLSLQPEQTFAELTAQAAVRLAEAETQGTPANAPACPIRLGGDPTGADFAIQDSELLYNAARFRPATAERFAARIHHNLAHPNAAIDALTVATPEERRLEAETWNRTDCEWPRESTLAQLFETQAARHPERPAVVLGDERLTYADLNRRANQLAHYLLARGVEPQELVGLCLERSPDLIVAVLGILKAGAAYLPVQPGIPAERRRLIAEDAAARHWITSRALGSETPASVESIVVLDRDRAEIEAQPAHNPETKAGPEDLAYCIFTSGSTGRPKGVLIEHRNVVRLLFNDAFAFDFSETDAWTLFHSISFDFSVWELFGALLYGGKLVIVPHETATDPDRFLSLLHKEDITVLNQTPSAFYQLIRAVEHADAPPLRYVIFGGEALQPAHLEPFRRRSPRTRLINMYGITETTVHVTYKEITESEIASNSADVGGPIPTTTLYLLDDHQRPLPIGAPGEICVGGAGVARGYLNRPDLTAERFVDNPFRPGEKLYRSGDGGHRLADGSVAYLGRIDNQVQIRGFRVEIGEVEAALAAIDGVEASAVIARAANGTHRLDAFFVARKAPLTTEQLRKALAARLPDYMIPASFTELRKLPLTANGKIDRKALATQPAAAPAPAARYVPPTNGLEQDLTAIWKSVLQRDNLGIEDNFFDLGGDSLLLIELRGAIRDRLQRELPVAALFQHPTIATLAKHMAGEQPAPEDLKKPQATTSNSVAIIGLAGRFPGAPNVSAFWQNLREGVESIRFFSREELLAAGLPADALDDRYVPANGALDDIDLFDADFFSIPPREAETMDPQHRILLECAWEALEDAGYTPENVDGDIGVFAGVGASSYLIRNVLPAIQNGNHLQLLMGSNKDFAPTRISYKLDLRGPSVNVNTACSTGLVAAHLACRSLLDGQCDMAIAGGAGVQVPQNTGYPYQENGIASPDGHCRPFDARAAGTVHGNGAGLVILKRLDDAIADGDNIRAVIRGSAVNNDGADKVGYTAPSVNGQRKVISAALAASGCPADSIGYVEAHGTGTSLGDPVEITALTQAFGDEQRATPCAVGSVKSNIGHLDEAAGVAGLIKATLAVQQGEIPPSLHYQQANPEIDFADRFAVNAQLRSWESETRRRAGVSSFGIGGTNAHAVLEQAPAREPASAGRAWQTLTLSARTPAALAAQAERLAAHLATQTSLPDVAYTLQVGRRAFPHRRAVVVRDLDSAIAELRDPASTASQKTDVLFAFSGQGSQYAGMGHALHQQEPAFREALDRCAEALEPRLGLDIREVICASHPTPEQDAQLRETALAQPALFAFEYALAQLLLRLGIHPQAMVGHSIGEYVAATLAGVFSLDDALHIVAERGRLMQSLDRGAMLAVQLPEADLAHLLNGDVTLALANAPGLNVLAGTDAAIASAEATLERAGAVCRRLETSHAFHSPMMDPVVEPFADLLSSVPLNQPEIPFVSNVSGDWIRSEEATDPAYWARHLRSTVRFGDALGTLSRDRPGALLEVGPGEALHGLAARHPDWRNRLHIALTPHPRRRADQAETLERAFARLWSEGVAIDWKPRYIGERRYRLALPTYPFERKRYWLDAPVADAKKSDKGIVNTAWAPVWEPASAVSASPRRRRWLVFGRDDQVEAALAQHGDSLLHAPAPEALGPFLESLGRQPDRILYLPDYTSPQDPLAAFLQVGQAIGEAAWRGVEFLVLTRERNTPDADPSRALIAAAAQALAHELPLNVRIVEQRDADPAAVAQELRARSQDRVTLLHGDSRFRRTFEPVDLEPPAKLVADAVYVITGGLGSMGLAFARRLADDGARKIALLARTARPTPELADLPAEVLVLEADIADRDAVESALNQTKRQLGPIQSVIHTAGILGQGLIRSKTAQELAATLRPKVQGVQVLDSLLPDTPFLLCSSSAALAPVVGQFDYSAANAYLDAFAHARQARGVPTLSVNWDFWQSLGMVENARLPDAEKQAIADDLRAKGLEREGERVFARLLAHLDRPQLIVSPEDFREVERRRAPEQQPEPVEHPLLTERLPDQFGLLAFSTRLDAAHDWVVRDHRPAGAPVLPGTAYLELAVAAYAQSVAAVPVELRDVLFLAPLQLDEDETREARTYLEPLDAGAYRFTIVSGADDAWTEHARGEIAALETAQPGPALPEPAADFTRHPAALLQAEYPTRWQAIEALSALSDGISARLRLPADHRAERTEYHLHPSLLDAAVGATALHDGFDSGAPFSYGAVRIHTPLPEPLHLRARYRRGLTPEALNIDVLLTDAAGQVAVEIEDYTMRRVAQSEPSAEPANFALELDSPGALSALALRPQQRPAPAPGEVEIEVAASGINFIETLFALGMLPELDTGHTARFGLECAGRIARVGPGVEDLQPGDEVLAFCSPSLAHFAIAQAHATARKPAHLSMAEAATIPAAYSTAYYALVRRGGLRPGEKILIHSAAGGVGMAAVQIAQWIGAEIFATAGSESKRERLRSLGIPHVMDSRTLDFADQIAEITSGRGVDVALNSLSGEFQARTLDTLAPDGRFLEVGKRDIFGGSSLSLAPFARRLSFIAIDVGPDMPNFPDLWPEMIDHIAARHFGPLPLETFPLARAADAFEHMAQAKHFGKLVIDVADRAGVSLDAQRPTRTRTLAQILNLDLPAAATVQPTPQPKQETHQRPDLTAPYREPTTKAEKAIAAIWESLLGVSPIGADDNFFELRGDSLLAAQATSQLYKLLGVKLPLSIAFDRPTPAELAVYIEGGKPAARAAAVGLDADEEEEGEL